MFESNHKLIWNDITAVEYKVRVRSAERAWQALQALSSLKAMRVNALRHGGILGLWLTRFYESVRSVLGARRQAKHAECVNCR